VPQLLSGGRSLCLEHHSFIFLTAISVLWQLHNRTKFTGSIPDGYANGGQLYEISDKFRYELIGNYTPDRNQSSGESSCLSSCWSRFLPTAAYP